MKSRAFRPFAATLSILLLAAVPAQAGPISFSEVVNVLSASPSGSQIEQLRLRAAPQEPTTSASFGDATKTQSGSAGSVETNGATPAQPSLIAEILPQEQPQANVNVFEQDNVDGTICDCGEISAVGGGFPKWPFLFLAGIPLFFIHHHHECETCNVCPTCPTPTPTPPEVPEPATLLLLGSGLAALGAGARRRLARKRIASEVTTEEA